MSSTTEENPYAAPRSIRESHNVPKFANDPLLIAGQLLVVAATILLFFADGLELRIFDTSLNVLGAGASVMFAAGLGLIGRAALRVQHRSQQDL